MTSPQKFLNKIFPKKKKIDEDDFNPLYFIINLFKNLDMFLKPFYPINPKQAFS